MNYGFIKASALTPKIRVADPCFNAASIINSIKEEYKNKVQLIVLPELILSASTCGDLFLQAALLNNVKTQLKKIVDVSAGNKALIIVGLPWEEAGIIYNAAAVITDGRVLAIVTKPYLSENELRFFTKFKPEGDLPFKKIKFFNDEIKLGENIYFQPEGLQFKIGVIFGNNAFLPDSCIPISLNSDIIAHCMAINEEAGFDEYTDTLLKAKTALYSNAYITANAGFGESTQDFVFSGRNLIAERGSIVALGEKYLGKPLRYDIDAECIVTERRKIKKRIAANLPFNKNSSSDDNYTVISYKPEPETYKINQKLERRLEPHPFIPENKEKRRQRCSDILNIQVYGLVKRMKHIGLKTAVLGISGGLDSTLAIIVCAKAFELLGLNKKGIHAVTMPGFGTTDRTYHNACELTKKLGVELEEINIVNSIIQHFDDIKYDINNHGAVYENAQARERTQILMDIANRDNSIVVGTGDLSELVLGWATYNGDHMSMYDVNASVPKTLIRHIIRYYSEHEADESIKAVLNDILDTPISPELLPAKDGAISQKTEDLVGPYELHDFFIYHVLRFGFSPAKIFYLAANAFDKKFEKAEILKWLEIFYKRFFTQQFKRSCLPDGPKTGSITVSPRGGLVMPSDAVYDIWIQELENIKEI